MFMIYIPNILPFLLNYKYVLYNGYIANIYFNVFFVILIIPSYLYITVFWQNVTTL